MLSWGRIRPVRAARSVADLSEGCGTGRDTIDLVLSPMERAHLPSVLEIEHASFTNPWRLADFEFALGREGSYCLVAHLDGGLVGYSVGFFVLAEYHLADFAVHPDRRRSGLGRAMLDRVISSLEPRPTDYVALEVRASNRAAIALYQGAGFETVAIRKGYYSLPTEDALVMLRALRGSLSDWAAAGKWR